MSKQGAHFFLVIKSQTKNTSKYLWYLTSKCVSAHL